jgi:hypothetical protein
MALTYVLISSNTVSGSTTTQVQFSSIPQTYTDLVLRASVRIDANNTNPLRVVTNTDSTGVISGTSIERSGSTASANPYTAQSYISGFGGINASGSTANTFSNFELYYPNYTLTVRKQISSFGVTENNAASSLIVTNLAAHSRTTTAAVSTLTISAAGNNFIAGSTFYLYGIKNS